MNIPIPAWVHNHLLSIVFCAWLLSNLAAALPSPNGSGFTSGWFYKTLFTFMHLTFGSVPRILATIFPAVGKLVGMPNTQEPK